MYLKCDGDDMIVLDPKWLCSTVCGHLLSPDFIESARVTGSYSLDDFQLALPEYDSKDILKVLEALGICIQVGRGDGHFYYFVISFGGFFNTFL